MRWLMAAVVVAAVGALWLVYRRDMRQAYARVAQGSKVVASPWGPIEYAEGGRGIPVLVVHGSGGGFDQGALLARAVLGEGFHWIAPSRFGYLRSGLPEQASFDEQAHAYAHLLDVLGVKRTAVVAISHGGPSALLLAVLHPERVTSITLLSAGVAAADSAAQGQANRQGDALARIYQHDWAYWGITNGLRGWFLQLMGAPADVMTRMTAEQRAVVEAVIDGMNPVRPRAAGVAFDNRAAMPNERIAAIRAPALIAHATDDTLQLYRHAEFAASRIRGARLLSFARGGHLLVAVELEALRAAIREHIRLHSESE